MPAPGSDGPPPPAPSPSVDGSAHELGSVMTQTWDASPRGHQASMGSLDTVKFLPVFCSSLKSKMPHQKLIAGFRFAAAMHFSWPAKPPEKGVKAMPLESSMTGSVWE